MKARLAALALALALLAVLAPPLVTAYVERSYNRLWPAASDAPSPAARELHSQLLIADLHADSLLWGRDLARHSPRGHLDIPRLIEGNVALQVFGIVTHTPRGLNIERNDPASDNITALAIVQRWPWRTWRSVKARALYQAERLHQAAAALDGRLVVIRSAADLRTYLERRQAAPRTTAGLLAVEGAHSLEGDLANLDTLFAAGVRMMSAAHFFDTRIGGSAHGVHKGGLTPLGGELVRRMQGRGMIVDLAHASPKTIDDTLAIARRPVLVSHTGVQGTCPNPRNLSDAQLRAIARTGGVIGIGYWETAVCGRDAKAIARAIRYTADLVGVRHVALGSDFDGAVVVPFDVTGLPQLTEALLRANFTPDELRLIMGGNVLRLLAELLPAT